MTTMNIASRLRRPLRQAAIAATMALALAMGPWGTAAQAQNTDRVVAVVTPPGGETNRAWAATSLWHALGQSLEGLVANDPVTGEYTGDGLATSWEHNEDRTQWTFHLRKGVQFHFGYGEFTAEDVVHSYNLSAGEASVIPSADQLRGAEVEVLDKYTVRFNYEKPRTDLGFFFREFLPSYFFPEDIGAFRDQKVRRG